MWLENLDETRLMDQLFVSIKINDDIVLYRKVFPDVLDGVTFKIFRPDSHFTMKCLRRGLFLQLFFDPLV